MTRTAVHLEPWPKTVGLGPSTLAALLHARRHRLNVSGCAERSPSTPMGRGDFSRRPGCPGSGRRSGWRSSGRSSRRRPRRASSASDAVGAVNSSDDAAFGDRPVHVEVSVVGPVDRSSRSRERLVGGAGVGRPRNEVVVRAVDGAQAPAYVVGRDLAVRAEQRLSALAPFEQRMPIRQSLSDRE